MPAPGNPQRLPQHGETFPSGSLRPISAGFDPQRLPIAVLPLDDEPAASWAVRFAHRYRMSVRSLLASMGITANAWTLQNFQSGLDTHHDVICDALGLEPQRLFAPSELSLASQHALDRYFTEYRPLHSRNKPGSRFCPRCLADRGGGWKHLWEQPLSMVCLDHQVFLRTTCPGCGGRPWSSRAWLDGFAPGWECARLLKRVPSGRGRRIPRCCFDLRDGVTDEPVASKHEVNTQQLIDRLASNSDRGDLRWPLFDQEFQFADVLSLLFEVLSASDPHGGGSPFSVGADPQWQMSRLYDGVAILSETDPFAANEHLLRSLGRHSRQAPLYASRAAAHTTHNPILTHIALSANVATMSPSKQLTYRTASRRPSYPTDATRRPTEGFTPREQELSLAWIPQALWPGTISEHLRKDDLDRATDALLLGRLGSNRSWQYLAIENQLPASYRTRPPARLRWLRKRDLRGTLHQELEDLGVRLAADPPPIGYHKRRLRTFDGKWVHSCTSRVVAQTGSPVPGIDSREWARLFWTVYTGGDIRLAPAPLGLPCMPKEHVDRHLSLVNRPEVTALLQDIRRCIEAAAGEEDDGPLTWAPP
ncbi:TniQ protein [Yimella lutea]|uniref:TniQ protein n=1 Tax=Yimella lutea TaxID=587872 RepID=A0A542EBI2_9MICO|nr:TniQ protein [Yimella lutea]